MKERSPPSRGMIKIHLKNANLVLVEQRELPITGPGELRQLEDCWKPGMVVAMTAPVRGWGEVLQQNKGQNSEEKESETAVITEPFPTWISFTSFFLPKLFIPFVTTTVLGVMGERFTIFSLCTFPTPLFYSSSTTRLM